MANSNSNYGIARYQAAYKLSQLPPQDQQDPVHNNNPNSSVNNTYNYNFASPSGGADEPVVTSTSGDTSPKPVDPYPNYGASGVARLEARLGIARAKPQTIQPDSDNSANSKTPDEQGYLKGDYKEIMKAVQEREDKDFEKKATYGSISAMGNALGGNVDYQQWWSGGLVK